MFFCENIFNESLLPPLPPSNYYWHYFISCKYLFLKRHALFSWLPQWNDLVHVETWRWYIFMTWNGGFVTKSAEKERDGPMDRVRKRMLSVMCLHSVLTRLCDIPVQDSFKSWERKQRRETERAINNAHWVLWGNSWWDMQWPKGNPFRPGQGASLCPAAFMLLEVDGWSVFILIMQTEKQQSQRNQWISIVVNQISTSELESSIDRDKTETPSKLLFQTSSELRPRREG